MHTALGEMAELTAERDALLRAAQAAPQRPSPRAAPAGARPAGSSGSRRTSAAASGPSVDDLLSDLKRANPAGGPVNSRSGRPVHGSGSSDRDEPAHTVDDELEALKRKMSSAPGTKKRGKP